MILHIANGADWAQARQQGHYRARSLEQQGFIHFSTPAQVLRVANAIFQGQRGLLLLCIDEQRLQAPLRYEPPLEAPESQERFPHLYGPLNLDAVTRVLPFEPGADGQFRLPPELDSPVRP